MMYNKELLNKRINEFDNYNDKIYEKNIDIKELYIFHKTVLDVSKNSDFIIKGSRAAEATLPVNIYKNNDILYSDYDIISTTPLEDLKKIAEELNKNGITNIKITNIIFKLDIFRLSIYNIPLIDIEQIEPKIFDKISYIVLNDIKYVDPDYWKIDLYSMLSRPVYINVKNWKKTLNRINIVEKHCKYNNNKTKSILKNHTNIIEEIVNKLNNNILITGSYAYSKLVNKIDIPYLELLTTNYKKDVSNMKNILNSYSKNIKLETNEKYLYMMGYNTVFYLDDDPICIIYNIDLCTSYVNIDNKKYTNLYFLKFYFNFLKYSYYEFIDSMSYYNYLLSTINIKDLPSLNCIGDINPGIKEYLEFVSKHKDKKLIIQY